MSMKSKLKGLTVKKETMTFPESDITIEVSGLTFMELAGLTKFIDSEDNSGSMRYLLFVTLRKSLPTTGDEAWTDEEVNSFINDLPSKTASLIIKKAQELSGLSSEEEKKPVGESNPPKNKQ